MLRRYENQTVTYNGEKLSYYDATQKQRYLERQVRRWKREYLMMDAAGQDTTKAAVKLNDWRRKLDDFLDQTGLDRQSSREMVNEFGRSQASKAVWTFRKNTLTNAAGQRIIRVQRVNLQATPNSITQRENAKGGVDRNYYGPDGTQIKQISNNGHGHKLEEAFGLHGEHAHDYYLNEKGNPVHGSARELTEEERKENSDIL